MNSQALRLRDEQGVAGDGALVLTAGLWRVALVPLDGIAHRELARRILTPEEFRVWGRLRFRKRRREWLGGRFAAKTAIRAYLRERGETGPPLSRMTIENSTAPWERGRPSSSWAPFLSISHSRGLAVAVASDMPVGVDVERQRPFSSSTIDTVFTESERRQLYAFPDDARERALTLTWCCKEAVMKSIGHGVFGWFDDIELLAGHNCSQTLEWRCSKRLEERLGGAVNMHAESLADYILVVAGVSSEGAASRRVVA